MSSVTHRSIVYFQDVTAGTPSKKGWLQAGFNSFAYRLAHLFSARVVMVFWLGAVFVFV
jgi:hypothetical protein